MTPPPTGSIRDEPPPKGRPLMRMTWLDLLFAHWPVSVAELRDVVPSDLEVETWEGAAWVGVVPFRMTGVTGWGLPAIPILSRLDEVNVRTYVRHNGRSGVFFLSLDATSWLAVRGARWLFGLPYHDAAIGVARKGATVGYRCRRGRRGPAFEALYRPVGAVEPPPPESFEAWLVNRPRLFAVHRGRVERTEIDHPAWPLQPAEARIDANTLAAASGVRLPSTPPHLLFSSRLDVRAWRPVRS